MLDAGVIYKVTGDLGTEYGFTPDGEGVVWYDTLGEAKAEAGPARVVSIDVETFDRLRWGWA